MWGFKKKKELKEGVVMAGGRGLTKNWQKKKGGGGRVMFLVGCKISHSRYIGKHVLRVACAGKVKL